MGTGQRQRFNGLAGQWVGGSGLSGRGCRQLPVPASPPAAPPSLMPPSAGDAVSEKRSNREPSAAAAEPLGFARRSGPCRGALCSSHRSHEPPGNPGAPRRRSHSHTACRTHRDPSWSCGSTRGGRLGGKMPAALSLLVASAECCALLVRSERLRGVKAIHARAVPWRPGGGALARLAFPHRLALRGAVACADAGRAGWPAWAVRMRMRLPRRHSSPTSAAMANRWRWQRRCDAQQAREPGSQPVSGD